MRVSIYHTKDGYTGIIKPPGVGTDERELTVLDRDGKEIAHSYSCRAENYFEFIGATERIVNAYLYHRSYKSLFHSIRG